MHWKGRPTSRACNKWTVSSPPSRKCILENYKRQIHQNQRTERSFSRKKRILIPFSVFLAMASMTTTQIAKRITCQVLLMMRVKYHNSQIKISLILLIQRDYHHHYNKRLINMKTTCKWINAIWRSCFQLVYSPCFYILILISKVIR